MGKMNKKLLRSYMAKFGDTQKTLAAAMGLSLSRLNAKINETGGAEFTQGEIDFIASRYDMTSADMAATFCPESILNGYHDQKEV